jgi:uncharacterized protein involved in outer membrane biogenesis
MTVTENPGGKGHGHRPWSKEDLRDRIVSDFRDIRLTTRGIFKWTGATLLGLILGVLFALYVMDWNEMRGPIGRWLSHRTGREVRIDGNLAVNLFTWQPFADAQGLFVGNPKWVGSPQAAKADRFRIEVRLVPLFWGHLVVPLVRIDQPDIMVVRDKDGRTNWDRANAGPNEAYKLPLIQRFLVQDGHLKIDDAVRKLHFTGTISSEENRGGGRSAFTLNGDGTLNTNKFAADISGGPLINVDASKPYEFQADIKAGQTHAVIAGAITQPFHFDRFTARVNVSGPSLSDLYFLTGLALPSTPAYHLTMAVERNGTNYRLNDINAELGRSDLHGNLLVDTANRIPALSGKLASRSLVLADLGPVLHGGKPAAASKYLLPDSPIHTDRLRQTNAEVDYSATKVKSEDFPLTSLDTHISLQNAVLNLKPLAFGFTQGKLAGSVKIDARGQVPTTTLDARVTDIHADNFIKSSDKPITGVLEARAVLTGTGQSIHAAASNANGTFTAVVPKGGFRHSLVEWTGVDVLPALGLSLSGDNSNTELRCAVASFSARNGVLASHDFVIDTDPVRIDAGGHINLADETLSLQLQGKPKNFQFVRLRAPITLTGPFDHPAIGIKPGPVIAQGGVAAALGLVNPLASILAFIDPGLAKDANCGPLLAQAKAVGAPVKSAAIANAPAPRK